MSFFAPNSPRRVKLLKMTAAFHDWLFVGKDWGSVSGL
jgi:hypothetical protein